MQNRIRDLREDLDLRQCDLAERTGIDQRTISNYETGKTAPDAYSLVKLADFFGVSIDYLVGRVHHDYSTNEKRNRVIEDIQKQLEAKFDELFGEIDEDEFTEEIEKNSENNSSEDDAFSDILG